MGDAAHAPCQGSWSIVPSVAGDLGGSSSPVAYGPQVSDPTHSDAPAVVDLAIAVDPLFHSLCFFCFCCTSVLVLLLLVVC
jgi:hypothetical protein